MKNENKACKYGKLDSMSGPNTFAIVYDGNTVNIQIRYNKYSFSQLNAMMDIRKKSENGIDMTKIICYNMTRKDVKNILRLVRANVRNHLNRLQSLRTYIHDIILPEEELSYPYVITAIERQSYLDPTFDLITVEEARTVIRGITYFLNNIRAWEPYHSMSLTMKLTDSNNCRLEKETYLP